PPYSEQVYPSIRKNVEEADQQRRLGEDLLFASDNKSWKEAEEYLNRARQLYQSAQKDARDLRAAMQVRDELFVELPYYTQWVANSARDDGNEPLIVGLWENLHELRRLLDDADLKGGNTEKQVAKISEKTEAVNKAMRSLRTALKLKSEERNPVLQKRWHEIED